MSYYYVDMCVRIIDAWRLCSGVEANGLHSSPGFGGLFQVTWFVQQFTGSGSLLKQFTCMRMVQAVCLQLS